MIDVLLNQFVPFSPFSHLKNNSNCQVPVVIKSDNCFVLGDIFSYFEILSRNSIIWILNCTYAGAWINQAGYFLNVKSRKNKCIFWNLSPFEWLTCTFLMSVLHPLAQMTNIHASRSIVKSTFPEHRADQGLWLSVRQSETCAAIPARSNKYWELLKVIIWVF